MFLRSDLDNDGQPNENIQLGGDSPASIRTRGGFIQFDSDVFMVQPADLNTTPGNENGAITFNGRFDGIPGTLTLAAGTAPITFNGAVGSIAPFGLTINSSGTLAFSQDVRMGGDFLFGNLTGLFDASNVKFDGRYNFTINPINDFADGAGIKIRLGDLGQTVPLASFTIDSSIGAATALFGNISTAGGAVVFRSPVQIWDENVAIQTTTLGNNAGAAITFENKLEGQLQAPGNYLARGLTLSAGNSGAVTFGATVGDAKEDDPTNPLTNFLVQSAGSISLGRDSKFTIHGDLTITPRLISRGQQADLSFTTFSLALVSGVSTLGDLTLVGGVDLSGVGVLNKGGSLELRGYRNVTIGNIDLVGGTPIGLQTGPGGAGGDLDISSKTGNIDFAGVNASGGDGSGTGGYGGNAGTLRVAYNPDNTLTLSAVRLNRAVS